MSATNGRMSGRLLLAIGLAVIVLLGVIVWSTTAPSAKPIIRFECPTGSRGVFVVELDARNPVPVAIRRNCFTIKVPDSGVVPVGRRVPFYEIHLEEVVYSDGTRLRDKAEPSIVGWDILRTDEIRTWYVIGTPAEISAYRSGRRPCVPGLTCD